MYFILALISTACAQFFGGFPMGGMGYGGMGYGGMGYGGGMYDSMYSAGGYGGMGGFGGLGGFGGGWLCGQELSEDELDELCCGGCCSPDGCCYELCGYEDGGYGSYGGYGYDACQPVCQEQIICRPPPQPQYYSRGVSAQDGRIAGYGRGNCANCYGAGQRDCGYNQGQICGQAGYGRLNADSARRHGDRQFARRSADEYLIRRANDCSSSGRDCYDSSRANLRAGGARVSGQRGCGNAHSCYGNAAGINSNARGYCGQAGCARINSNGCGSGGCQY